MKTIDCPFHTCMNCPFEDFCFPDTVEYKLFNTKKETINTKQRTRNNEHETPNNKQQTP
jgi:hypothetical protein